ncbi:MAG: hypothetical protein IKU88_03665 [Alistipes sp.]|nr:hypothetical protein [Alistipes sp.]
MKRIAIIGAGAYGQQILTFIQNDSMEKFSVVGFFDDYAQIGSTIAGLPVLGSISDVVIKYTNDEFDCVFIAIGYKHFEFKEKVYDTIKGIIPLANIICKHAFIHPTAKLGEGVFIGNFVVINMGAELEDNVTVTLHSIINHDSLVKKHTFISTRVTTAGNVVIGGKCFIGVASVISDGVHIVDSVWLSPATIVVKDIKNAGHYMSAGVRILSVPTL